MPLRILTGTRQASALAAAAFLLAACGSSGSPQTSGSPQASRPTTANSTAAFCSAARRFGNDQKTFARYAEKEPASVMARMLSVAKDAESALGEMQRLTPASLTADVQVYESTEKPIIDGIIANRGQLNQQIEKDKKDKGSDMKSGNPKLQRAVAGIGDKCVLPGSVLMPMPSKGTPSKG
jgi:hypothetical protein